MNASDYCILVVLKNCSIMKVKDLPADVLAAIKKTRYDRIVEKHEGPESWDYQLDFDSPRTQELIEMYRKNGLNFEPSPDAEFLQIGGTDVLLPVSANQHPNMTILHHFFSEDRSKLVLYIKNTTWDDSAWSAGFVAICDKFASQEFYLATFYHEWFIIDYDPLADLWRMEKRV